MSKERKYSDKNCVYLSISKLQRAWLIETQRAENVLQRNLLHACITYVQLNEQGFADMYNTYKNSFGVKAMRLDRQTTKLFINENEQKWLDILRNKFIKGKRNAISRDVLLEMMILYARLSTTEFIEYLRKHSNDLPL